jgi:hypothetical protein
MRMLNRLFARLWNFGFGRRGDERLREEMEGHVAMQAQENVREVQGNRSLVLLPAPATWRVTRVEAGVSVRRYVSGRPVIQQSCLI